MNSTVRSSLRTSKFMRPITSFPKGGKGTRHSATTALAPLPPQSSELQTRPMTRSSLEVKKWRQSLFPATSPASKREVELLGEWLNSVLAENLEQNDNPLDVCTNAQHWFSVAFNELVRQVSIDCAERGRLFAVIWKRNQDLLTKLVQVQREERQYILQCHKDRMQFLKTDLEFCQSRLSTVSTAYNDEHNRWASSHERDISKFDSLQQKIDEQIKGRKELMDELNGLRKQLGLPDEKAQEIEPDEPSQPFTQEQINTFVQSFRWQMREEKVDPLDIVNALDNINHYIEIQSLNTTNIRQNHERFFLSLPPDAQPTIRPIPWVLAIISYIYSYYMSYLASASIDKSITSKPFADVVYEQLLTVYGSRIHTEQVLFDLLSTIRKSLDTGMQRLFQFARFFGLVSPLPIECFHFYMHAVTMMNRAHSGPLYPEVEAGDAMISGIPTPAACSASQKIFERFASGRSLKFYTERLNKIASDGMMRFGGKNLAELDSVLDYILSAYVEECAKLEDSLKDLFAKLPEKEITSFSQFHTIMTNMKTKPDPQALPRMFREAIRASPTGGISCEQFLEIVKNSRLNLPIEMDTTDFLNDQNPDDVVKFMQMELQEHTPVYEELLQHLEKIGDDIMLKQVKSSKAKFDQALASRSLGRTFQTIQREFYEKLYMVKAFHKLE